MLTTAKMNMLPPLKVEKPIQRRLRLPHLRLYQKRLLTDTARDVLVVSATQVGKSFAAACWIVAEAWLDPDKRFASCWYAPTYKQAKPGINIIDMLFGADGAGIIVDGPLKTAPYTTTLLNGSRIEFRTWDDPQNLMGDTIARGVVEEAGLLTPRAHGAISSRRSATLGPLRYIGNPGLVAGPFRKLASLAESGEPNLSLHKWTWQDKLAELPEAEAAAYQTFIEQEKLSQPDFEFRRLYEAEWTEDEAAVFTNIHEVTDGQQITIPTGSTLNGDQYVIGVDVGQRVDYFAAVLLSCKQYRVDHLLRFRGVSYPDAALRVKELQDRTNAPVIIESNGPGIAVIQEFDRLGVRYIPFTTTVQSKQTIITNLAADFAAMRIKLADVAPLQYELSAYRYSRLPSGLYRYSAPPGEHDDTVMALAIAAHARRTSIVDLSQYGWLT